MTKRVLIIDDSDTVRRNVIQVLAPAGFEILTASDGVSGLAKLQTTSDLDMAIIDLNLPGLTGIAILERLREKDLPLPPVVMMTTEVSPGLIERAKRAGALGWVVKPFKPEQLLALVRKATRTA